MIYSKRRIKAVVVLCVMALAICGVFLFCIYSPRAMILITTRRAHAAQVRLLCRTDHKALQEAGRQTLRQVSMGNTKPGRYKVRCDPHLPKGLRFPEPILGLSPRAVTIRDEYMIIEMHGAMWHFGVFVYPEDFTEPYSGFDYGDRKLLEGLWYYDDEYVHDPEYDKVIEAMLQRGGRGQGSHR